MCVLPSAQSLIPPMRPRRGWWRQPFAPGRRIDSSVSVSSMSTARRRSSSDSCFRKRDRTQSFHGGCGSLISIVPSLQSGFEPSVELLDFCFFLLGPKLSRAARALRSSRSACSLAATAQGGEGRGHGHGQMYGKQCSRGDTCVALSSLSRIGRRGCDLRGALEPAACESGSLHHVEGSGLSRR